MAGRLLIIEEEALTALYVERVAEEWLGLSSTIARDYVAAAALTASVEDFALAIVNFPRTAGEPTIQRLIVAGIPIILSTGSPGQDRRAVGLDAAIVLAKPFTEEELLAACRKALGKPDAS